MEVKLIDLYYKDIFKNINIQIKENKIVAIMGKNGSGKTAFLNLLLGIDKDFDGEICIGKRKINRKSKLKSIKSIRQDISYLRQDYESDLFNMNILEDIKYRVPYLDFIKLDELLNIFGLEQEILEKCYLDLSSTEVKKILLVKIFIEDSKIILLDDPTSGLDQKSIINLIKLLKRNKRNGKIIIITSTNSEFLIKISDEFIVLNGKKIYYEYNKYNLLSNINLLNTLNLNVPNIIKFKLTAYNRKKIKLVYRDNINDLIKDIYRNAK